MPPDTASIIGSTEMCDLAGCTYRQLDYWTRCEVIRPHVPADGPGSRRQWRRDQVPVLRMLTRLSALGAEGHVLERAACCAEHDVDLAGCTFVVVGEDGSIGRPGQVLEDGYLVRVAEPEVTVGQLLVAAAE